MVDNYDIWLAHEREQQNALDRLPYCVRCGEHIQDDILFDINDELYCRDCAEAEFERSTEDYIR